MNSIRNIAALLITLAFTGCLDGELEEVTSAPSGDDTSSYETGPWPVDTGTAEPTCALDSHDDSDGDGLLDILEDTNRNCQLDPGETDPNAGDSDGDGLADGDEDIDRNGQWDESRGELDPRVADTDGDGVQDGEERIAAVCNSTLYDQLRGRVGFGGRELYSSEEAILSETYGNSAWIDFGGGRVDCVTSESTIRMRGPSPGARVWFESVTSEGELRHSDWDVTDPLELFTAMESAHLVARVPDNPTTATAPFHVTEHQATDGRGRVSLNIEGIAAPSAYAISPASDAVSRARCLEAEVADPLTSVELIFVFATDEESLLGAADVFETLAEVMTVRAGAGLETRVWLVPADAHVWASAGAPLGGQGFSEPAEARAIFAGLGNGASDQRIWMNARAGLQVLQMGRLEGVPVLVTLGSREDPEYRDGTTEGYDGHAFGEPHPVGAARTALDRFYLEFFNAAVSRRQVHLLTGNCDQGRSYPSSAREMAASAEGVFVDLCGSAARPLMRTVVHRVGEARRRALGPNRPLPGSHQTNADWSEDSATGNTLGWVSIDADTPVPVGYLFWDSTPENE